MPVKVGPNLKLYRLPPRYQRLYTMGNGTQRINVPTGIDNDWPGDLRVSGGMASYHGWSSMKGLDIPDGAKIQVWREDTDVRAFSLVPRWRWRFPAGTVAYDILSTDKGVFEVRTQTKTNGGEWRTKVLFKDLDKTNGGYAGLSQSCASCHDNTGAIIDVPGKIYRHVIWGDDGRFSWRPFDDGGNLDRRWPIQEKH